MTPNLTCSSFFLVTLTGLALAAGCTAAPSDDDAQSAGSALSDTLFEGDEIDATPATDSASAFRHVRVTDADRAAVQGDPREVRRRLGNPNRPMEAEVYRPSAYAYAVGNTYPPEDLSSLTADGFFAGTEAARICMAKGSRQLASYTQGTFVFDAIAIALHGPLGVVQLNNDYSTSADAVGVKRRVSHVGDTLVWVTETNRDGTCMIPTRDAFLTEQRLWRAELDAAAHAAHDQKRPGSEGAACMAPGTFVFKACDWLLRCDENDTCIPIFQPHIPLLED